MSAVKFIVYDTTGKKINNAKAVFKYGILGDIVKPANAEGDIAINGIKNGDYEFIIECNEKQTREKVSIVKDNSYIEKVVIL